MPEDVPGSHEICPVCFWHHDYYQFKNPSLGGANKVSLNEAKQNFKQFKAKSKEASNSWT